MSNPTLTNFPNSIDTFGRVSDLDKNIFNKAKEYKKKLDSGDYTGAETYLKANQDLARCGIDATTINRHSDAITALETETLQLKTNIGDSSGSETISRTSGTGSAYTTTCSWYTEKRYVHEQRFTIQFHTENAASATLNINGLGARDIVYGNSKLTAGQIRENDILLLQANIYNEQTGNFQVIGQIQTTDLTADTSNNTATIKPLINGNTPTAIQGIKLKGTGGVKITRPGEHEIDINTVEFPYNASDKTKLQIGILTHSTETFKIYTDAFYKTTDFTSPITISAPWYKKDGCFLNERGWRHLIGVEGSIITKYRQMYPIGYNGNGIKVNACLEHATAGNDYVVQIKHEGIEPTNIIAVIGIIKYIINPSPLSGESANGNPITP